MDSRLSLCIAASLLIGWTTTLACGDKLAVIGGGVPYERLSNGPRGDIILLVEPNSTLRLANDELNLKRSLEFAGHKVRTVDSPDALAAAVSRGKTDVVLVSWQDANRLQAQLAAQSPAPTVMPVAYKSPAQASEPASEVRCVAQADRRKGRDLVEAVSQAVQQRRAGRTVDCAAGITAHSD